MPTTARGKAHVAIQTGIAKDKQVNKSTRCNEKSETAVDGMLFLASQGVTEDEHACGVSTVVDPASHECPSHRLLSLPSPGQEVWLLLCEHFLFSLSRQLGSLMPPLLSLMAFWAVHATLPVVPVHVTGTSL